MKEGRFNVWMVAFFCFLGLIVGSVGTYGLMKHIEAKSGAKAEEAAKQEENKKFDFDYSNVVALGSESAPVTITEFSDFQCPACGAFVLQVWPDLKAKYVDTGKVRFIMKDFPLFSIHPNAEKASEASHCAQEQGKFWEMHDSLFKNVKLWNSNKTPEKVFTSLAKDLKLDTKQFDSCLSSNKYQQVVIDSLKEGVGANVEGTPTFFINGVKTFFGAYPLSSFDSELQKYGVN